MKIHSVMSSTKKDPLTQITDIILRKCSEDMIKMYHKGLRKPVETSFAEGEGDISFPIYTSSDGQDTVYEADLKKIDPNKACARWDTQLRECGLVKYQTASFESINTYKFLSQKNKFPKDLLTVLESFPIAYFHGGPGTGKTTLACAIGRQYARKGKSVLLRRWSNWLQQFRETYDESSEEIISNHMYKAQSATLLILDELGNDKKKQASEFEIEQLSRIVSDRYGNGKPMIITSNLEPEQLELIYGKQISSRLKDKSKSVSQRFDRETDYRKAPRSALFQPELDTF